MSAPSAPSTMKAFIAPPKPLGPPAEKQMPGTVVRTDGDVKFPSITGIYDFFSPRTKKIENWSFGFRNGGVETEIAESSGSKIKIFDGRLESKAKYDIFERIMKTHETQEGDPKWAEVLTDHWILPDSTKFSSTVPYEFSGSMDISGTLTSLSAIDVEAVPQVDICKVDYDGFTPSIVYNILHCGYRPGLFYVNWPLHPDESNVTMICAGHLQTCGYRLLKSVGNYFLYIFVDSCMYELCSWAKTDCANPMFIEFRSEILESINGFLEMNARKETNE